MRVYWWESGGWQDYEWYTPHLSGTWFEGYELFGMLSWWLNMDYPLLSGHLLVADDWLGIPWMVQLMYDRFGVYVGQRFYPAKVKRKPHYLRQHPDVPPPLYTPPNDKPTYRMCVDLCQAFANAFCQGAGVGIELPPLTSDICGLIAEKGCVKLCEETNKNFNPFFECWTICPSSPDCVECCNRMCKWNGQEVQKGGLAICYKACAIAP